MVVLVNVIKPQGLEPLQFPTKFRSPSIFAPSATLRFYDRWLLSTNARFRVRGVVFETLAMALLFSDFGEGVLAGLLHTFGWFM